MALPKYSDPNQTNDRRSLDHDPPTIAMMGDQHRRPHPPRLRYPSVTSFPSPLLEFPSSRESAPSDRERRQRALPRSSRLPLIVLPHLVIMFLILLPFGPAAGGVARRTLDDNPYSLLGLSRSADSAEIKSAYRRKARDTHPDKNVGADPEVAAEEFRRVVDAYELLSDEGRRKAYDRTGSTRSTSRHGGNRGQTTTTYTFRNGRFYASTSGGSSAGRRQRQQQNQQQRNEEHISSERRRMMNRSDVKQAMSRVMHVSSLDQLKSVILNNDGRLERSLLICFASPGVVDRRANDEGLFFPYPFAGMSAQRIWWEDIIQTAYVKYYELSDLSNFFGLPEGKHLTQPALFFVKRGNRLNQYETLFTSHRKTFESWMWKNLHKQVIFRNDHTHPVELFWINSNKAKLMGTINPGKELPQNTMLTHEFWARDARVDSMKSYMNRKLSQNSTIGIWKIVSDVFEKIVIETQCTDMSGRCEQWVKASPGECAINPRYMLENCKRTCGVCDAKSDAWRKHDEL